MWACHTAVPAEMLATALLIELFVASVPGEASEDDLRAQGPDSHMGDSERVQVLYFF